MRVTDIKKSRIGNWVRGLVVLLAAGGFAGCEVDSVGTYTLLTKLSDNGYSGSDHQLAIDYVNTVALWHCADTPDGAMRDKVIEIAGKMHKKYGNTANHWTKSSAQADDYETLWLHLIGIRALNYFRHGFFSRANGVVMKGCDHRNGSIVGVVVFTNE